MSRVGSKPKNYRSVFDKRPVVAQSWNETTEQMRRQKFPAQNRRW